MIDKIGFERLERISDAELIYGIEWAQGETAGSPTLRHIDINGDTLPLRTTDFDNHPIWGGMRRCTMAPDGSINSYGINPRGDGLDLTGVDGRVMVEIPKFYAKSMSPKANVYDFWFSPVPIPSFDIFPAFLQRGGIERDNIYIGAYEAGNTGTVLDCQTGDVVTVSQNIGTFRAWANNIGPRWGLVNPWTLSAVQLLYYIEYANLNSQTTIGRGRVDAGSKLGTGADGMDSSPQMAINGTGMGSGTNGLTPIAYRGIENLWGNVWEFIDGWNAIGDAVTGKYHIIRRDGLGNINDVDGNGMLNAGNYEASVAVPLTGTAGNYVNGYASNIEYEDLLAFLFIPSSVTGGSVSTYLCDRFFSHKNGSNNILLALGIWFYGTDAGVAERSAYDVVASSTRSQTARLERI